MPRDNRLYLRHILDAISKVETYLDGIDRKTFSEQTVWLTAREDLPILKAQMTEILAEPDLVTGS